MQHQALCDLVLWIPPVLSAPFARHYTLCYYRHQLGGNPFIYNAAAVPPASRWHLSMPPRYIPSGLLSSLPRPGGVLPPLRSSLLPKRISDDRVINCTVGGISMSTRPVRVTADCFTRRNRVRFDGLSWKIMDSPPRSESISCVVSRTFFLCCSVRNVCGASGPASS